MSPKKVNVNISNHTIVRTILWVIFAILVFRFIGRISHVLTLIFASFFLALALNPVVSWMSRHLKTKSRARATAAAYLTVVVIIGAFLTMIIPPLVQQTRDFIQTIPGTVQNFQSQNSSIAKTVRRYHLDEKITQGAKDFAAKHSNFGSTILDTSKRVGEALASILVVLILTFMMLVEGPYWLELIWGALATKERERYQQLAKRSYKAVTSFVNGQVILAAVAGVFAFVALEIASHLIDVSINTFALAGIVAMFGIIPLFGNPVAATIVTLVCLLNSPTLGIVMLIYFVVYFFVENHTFQPYLQSRLNELTPLTVLIAALIGVAFAGFLGAIIAIPAASTVKILLEDHFKRRQHKEPSTEKLSL